MSDFIQAVLSAPLPGDRIRVFFSDPDWPAFVCAAKGAHDLLASLGITHERTLPALGRHKGEDAASRSFASHLYLINLVRVTGTAISAKSIQNAQGYFLLVASELDAPAAPAPDMQVALLDGLAVPASTAERITLFFSDADWPKVVIQAHSSAAVLDSLGLGWDTGRPILVAGVCDPAYARYLENLLALDEVRAAAQEAYGSLAPYLVRAIRKEFEHQALVLTQG